MWNTFKILTEMLKLNYRKWLEVVKAVVWWYKIRSHVRTIKISTLGEFMILQKFELCKVQLTHGANQLYIHGNEKLNCLGSTGRSRSQIKSFTVCFLYANSSCRLRLPCKGYNSIRTLPRHSAAMSRCAADWAGAPLPWRGAWWCFTHHPPAPGPARAPPNALSLSKFLSAGAVKRQAQYIFYCPKHH